MSHLWFEKQQENKTECGNCTYIVYPVGGDIYLLCFSTCSLSVYLLRKNYEKYTVKHFL